MFVIEVETLTDSNVSVTKKKKNNILVARHLCLDNNSTYKVKINVTC